MGVASWISEPMTPHGLLAAATRVIKALEPVQFDSIAFRGMSGALVAPVVAAFMGKHLLMVRKGERCHSDRTVEFHHRPKAYVIVDDCIDSGETVNTIVGQVQTATECAAPVAIVLYDGMPYGPVEFPVGSGVVVPVINAGGRHEAIV